MLVPSPNLTVTMDDSSANLSCELYGYLMRRPPTITWNFGSDVLMNDSVFTITVQDGSHMIQNGGDTPQPSMRSVLTINHPSRTLEGSYVCSVSGCLNTITLQGRMSSNIVTAYFVAFSSFTSATFLPCCVYVSAYTDTNNTIDAIISPNSCPSNHFPTTPLHGATCTTRARQCGVSFQPLLYCGQ